MKSTWMKPTLVTLAAIAFWIVVDIFFEKGASTGPFIKMHPILRTLPYLFSVFCVILSEWFSSEKKLRKVLLDFGFKRPLHSQLVVTLCGLIILVLGYFTVSKFFPESFHLRSNWQTSAVKFLLEAGVAEEVLFRGYLFRRLRATQSFFRAASISGIAFGSIHLVNFLDGVSMGALVSVAVSVTFGFLLTFSFAALFELGGGALLGGILFHFGVDTINLFENVEPGALVLCLAVAAFSGLVVFVLAYRKMRLNSSGSFGAPIANPVGQRGFGATSEAAVGFGHDS